MTKYTYHGDAGHGWLEVPYRDLRKRQGLKLCEVSGFSYGQVTDKFVLTLYLEEDCDMALFLNALQAKGEEFELVEKHHDGDAFIHVLESVMEEEEILLKLGEMRQWNSFAMSLLVQYTNKGNLSERQWDAAENMINKVQRRTERREEMTRDVDDVPRIKTLLDNQRSRNESSARRSCLLSRTAAEVITVVPCT